MLAGSSASARVGVAQLRADGPGPGEGSWPWREGLLASATEAVAAAAAAGCDVVVLPEYTSGWMPRLTPDLAVPEDGDLVRALRRAAAEAGIVVVVGLLVRADGGDGARARNVTLVIGADGAVRGRYAKVHLYDAYGVRESELIEAGDPGSTLVLEVPVPAGSLLLGVVTCYDLRFPEAMRALTDLAGGAGGEPVDLVAVGAAWSAGEHKSEQLRTLARARAIENTAYVALASQAGPGRVGGSAVVDPRGVVVAAVDDDDALAGSGGLAVATVSGEVLGQVRAMSPVLAHRRYRVTPA